MKVEKKQKAEQEDIEFAKEAEKAKRIAFEESRGCEIQIMTEIAAILIGVIWGLIILALFKYVFKD